VCKFDAHYSTQKTLPFQAPSESCSLSFRFPRTEPVLRLWTRVITGSFKTVGIFIFLFSKQLVKTALHRQLSKALKFNFQPSKLRAPPSAAWLFRALGWEIVDGFSWYNSQYINCGIAISILLEEQLYESRLISYEDMLRKWTCHVKQTSIANGEFSHDVLPLR